MNILIDIHHGFDGRLEKPEARYQNTSSQQINEKFIEKETETNQPLGEIDEYESKCTQRRNHLENRINRADLRRCNIDRPKIKSGHQEALEDVQRKKPEKCQRYPVQLVRVHFRCVRQGAGGSAGGNDHENRRNHVGKDTDGGVDRGCKLGPQQQRSN